MYRHDRSRSSWPHCVVGWFLSSSPNFLLICLSSSVLFFESVCSSSSAAADTPFGTFPPVRICGINGFDYYNLTVKTWKVDFLRENCLPNKSNYTDPPESCAILIAFCRALDPVSTGCDQASLCHTSNQGSFPVGGYVPDPYQDTVPAGVSDGFEAEFPNGAQYRTGDGRPCHLQTELQFVCNRSAKWLLADLTKGIQKAPNPTSVLYDNTTCMLTLRFDFAGACSREDVSSQTLSPGTVLIAVFSVSLICYFTIGCMFNIARGKTGSQIVPHSAFWTMLPVYIMDGFVFTFCCGRLPVTNTYENLS